MNNAADLTTAAAEAAERPQRSLAKPTPASAWGMLCILTLAYGFACMDRFAFAAVMEPMRIDLGATDTQMGLIGGAAFIVFYSLFTIPMARWSDRGHRPLILSICIAAWSLATLLSGMATAVWHAAVARIGLGMAEAGGSPASLSLLSDIFPEDKRTLANSIYQSGMPIAAIIGSPILGFLAQAYGWRAGLIMLAAPGFVVALMAGFLLREPRAAARRAARAEASPIPKQPGRPLRQDLARLGRDRRYVALLATQLFIGLPTGVLPIWYGVMLIRGYGMEVGEAAFASGMLFGVAMLFAYLAGGLVITRAIKQTRRRRYGALIPGVCCILSAPFAVMAFLTHDLTQFVILSTIFLGLTFASRPSAMALALDFAPTECRAVATGVLIIVTSVIGGGLGPVLVGLLSDGLAPQVGPGNALRYALLITVPLGIFLSGLAYLATTAAMKQAGDEVAPSEGVSQAP